MKTNDKINKEDKLQTRREFFKSAAKKTLPIIGILALSSLNISCDDDLWKDAEDQPSTDSINLCSTCKGTCKSGCSTTCNLTCGNSGCTAGCKHGSYY